MRSNGGIEGTWVGLRAHSQACRWVPNEESTPITMSSQHGLWVGVGWDLEEVEQGPRNPALSATQCPWQTSQPVYRHSVPGHITGAWHYCVTSKLCRAQLRLC